LAAALARLTSERRGRVAMSGAPQFGSRDRVRERGTARPCEVPRGAREDTGAPDTLQGGVPWHNCPARHSRTTWMGRVARRTVTSDPGTV
jgi:hypothetical protein